MAFDFPAFAQRLTQATQAAFTELLALHPTEAFYSFALYSDEGALTICPAANTLDHLAGLDPDDLPYAKFEPAEWKYEMVGADAQFDALSQQLRAAVLDGGFTGAAFRTFRQQLFATCIEVLATLQQQGFFEAAAGRPVFLLFTVSDADTPTAALAQLVGQLNDNAYRDEYLAWLRSWDEPL